MEEGSRKSYVLFCFGLYVVVSLLVGFAAFLGKFSRVATELKDSSALWAADERVFRWSIIFDQLLDIVGFLNQVCGITLVWQINERRLFLFVFGGGDSRMQAGELDRQYAFLASVTMHLCTDLWASEPTWRRSFKRAVALITFTDLDVQALILDEDESLGVDAVVLRARTPDSQALKSRASAQVVTSLSASEWSEMRSMSCTMPPDLSEPFQP